MSLEMENDNGDSLIKNEFTVSLEGGRPWGFTLQGGVDFRSPLKVGKVTAGGKAATAGLIAGDVIININGISTSSMKHHEAQRLIAASKTSLELTCTKNTPGSFMSPKSSTQLSTFEFPTRSSSHTRQRSLDFNFMRPRSSSDAGKRALVGENIAGIKVPAPPPSMRKRSESTVVRPAQETPVKYVAGIKVPPPPPSSTKSKSTGSAPFETTPGDQTLVISGPPIMTDSDVTQNDNDNSTTANVQSFNVELSSIEHIPATTQQEEPTGTTSEAQVNDILSAIQSEFGSEDTSSSRNDDSTDDKDTLNESQTSGYKSIASSYEDDVVISNNGGNDWYRSMFQNMKKGVEEDLPNKKHVCDRSPVPPRKSILDEKENETSVASGASGNKRRSSESTLDLSPEHKSFGRTSSSGTVPDAVNTLNSGVVFRRNVQSFNHSRNYWKGIERQASQEKIELANKRNSLRRSSSATCTAPSLSPDSFKVPPKVPPKKSRASTSGVPEITEVFKETINLIADFESELERKSSVNSDSSDTTKSDTAANTETVKTDIDINTTPDTINTDVIQIIENDTTNTDSVNTEITKIDITNTDTINTEITEIDIANTTNTDTVNTEITEIDIANTDTVNTEITEIDIANTTNTDTVNTDTDIVKSTTPDMSKIHPLLRGSVDEGDQIEKIDDDVPQQDLFTRIDPSKLNNAIGNASVLGKMQQEGVDTLALQTTAISLAQQSQQEQPPPQKKKSKTIKEPPGKLAKALFDFEAASDKELSFKKDTVIELTETINADWLRGVIDGRTGMFPVSYVKVITENEIISLSQPEPDLNIFAKGLYNFEAKSPKELSFHKGDIITLLKKIDDNWYRGELQDNTGLVPVTYLQFFDPEQS